MPCALERLPLPAQERIAAQVAQPAPPPRALRGAGAQIASRAWYEWHRQRGRDPLRRRRSIPLATRLAVLARDGYVCQLCGGAVAPGDVHLDHRIPVARGGRDDSHNLQVAHAVCNLRKGARLP